MFKIKPTASLYIITCLIMLVLLACQGIGSPPPTPTISTRTISESHPTVKEIWRISPLLVASNKRGFAYFVQASGKIIGAVNLYFGNDNRKLAAFDTSTGELIWDTALDRLLISSIVSDQERVYIATAGRPLKAYNLEDGNLAWSGPELAARRPYFLNIQNNVLLNYFTGMVQSIDAQSGALLNEEQEKYPDEQLYIVMKIDGFDLFETVGTLYKIKQDTEEILWQTSIDEDSGWVRPFPILHNNKLVMVVGEADPDLYVVDFETGQRLWKSNDTFVSNVAVSNGKVYALRDDAKLIIFDEMTGAEVGYIQFAPAETDPSSKTYWVGADEEGQIFVYFSDSRELIALEPQ